MFCGRRILEEREREKQPREKKWAAAVKADKRKESVWFQVLSHLTCHET